VLFLFFVGSIWKSRRKEEKKRKTKRIARVKLDICLEHDLRFDGESLNKSNTTLIWV
jgi:hypothetical protein